MAAAVARESTFVEVGCVRAGSLRPVGWNARQANTKARKRADEDTEGHKHTRVKTKANTKAITKARKREDEDTQGHVHTRVKTKAITKAHTR